MASVSLSPAQNSITETAVGSLLQVLQCPHPGGGDGHGVLAQVCLGRQARAAPVCSGRPHLPGELARAFPFTSLNYPEAYKF